MTRYLLVLAAVAGCASPHAPTVRAVEEDARTVGTASAPSPVPRSLASHTPRKEASRSRPTVDPTWTGTHNLNWRALAQCESGGDPRAVSRTGKFRGLVQFSLSSWHAVGMAGDPIDYPASVQIEAARRLYAIQGPGAWPYCRRFL